MSMGTYSRTVHLICGFGEQNSELNIWYIVLCSLICQHDIIKIFLCYFSVITTVFIPCDFIQLYATITVVF